MTGNEPWLKYDDLRVFTKLLVDNKVPYYYFEEFINEI